MIISFRRRLSHTFGDRPRLFYRGFVHPFLYCGAAGIRFDDADGNVAESFLQLQGKARRVGGIGRQILYFRGRFPNGFFRKLHFRRGARSVCDIDDSDFIDVFVFSISVVFDILEGKFHIRLSRAEPHLSDENVIDLYLIVRRFCR